MKEEEGGMAEAYRDGGEWTQRLKLRASVCLRYCSTGAGDLRPDEALRRQLWLVKTTHTAGLTSSHRTPHHVERKAC